MGVMAMLVPSTFRLDINKCIKMSLTHTLAALIVGDITPADGVPKSEKNQRGVINIEYLAIALLGRVDGGVVG